MMYEYDSYDKMIDEIYTNLIEDGVFQEDGSYAIHKSKPVKPNKNRYLYVYSGGGKYELPLAICDSMEELAEALNYPIRYVKEQFDKNNSRYYRVKLTKAEYEEIHKEDKSWVIEQ